MNRLQLATLLSWAGDAGVKGRKRLQKVVYFLQQAGCPLGCQYRLHHFGPYSMDVADICDEMVAADLVEEEQTGSQYNYKLATKTRDLLKNAASEEMSDFRTLGEKLISKDLWNLELGSTILLYHDQEGDWDEAFKQACSFKNVNVENESSQKAFELAKSVLPARPQ